MTHASYVDWFLPWWPRSQQHAAAAAAAVVVMGQGWNGTSPMMLHNLDEKSLSRFGKRVGDAKHNACNEAGSVRPFVNVPRMALRETMNREHRD